MLLNGTILQYFFPFSISITHFNDSFFTWLFSIPIMCLGADLWSSSCYNHTCKVSMKALLQRNCSRFTSRVFCIQIFQDTFVVVFLKLKMWFVRCCFVTDITLNLLSAHPGKLNLALTIAEAAVCCKWRGFIRLQLQVLPWRSNRNISATSFD